MTGVEDVVAVGEENQWPLVRRQRIAAIENNMTPQSVKPLIINFEFPHEIGSICVPPCRQCRDTEDNPGVLILEKSTELIPMKILGVAPYSEYVRQCREFNGRPVRESVGYNYYVSVD